MAIVWLEVIDEKMLCLMNQITQFAGSGGHRVDCRRQGFRFGDHTKTLGYSVSNGCAVSQRSFGERNRGWLHAHERDNVGGPAFGGRRRLMVGGPSENYDIASESSHSNGNE